MTKKQKKNSDGRLLYVKSYRILILAAVFFVSSLVFFWGRFGGDKKPSIGAPARVALTPSGLAAGTSMAVVAPQVKSTMPAPTTFQHFTYNPSTISKYEVQVTCQDDYYTILIFPQTIDYRQNVLGAKYNKATACSKPGSLIVSLSLSELPLSEGDYYVVRAHQGKSGAWYDPY